MPGKPDSNEDEKSIRTLKKCLIGGGAVCALVGLARQWPVIGKSYMEFIEGPGYMALIIGLIMVVLGCSVRLLVGGEEESTDN